MLSASKRGNDLVDMRYLLYSGMGFRVVSVLSVSKRGDDLVDMRYCTYSAAEWGVVCRVGAVCIEEG